MGGSQSSDKEDISRESIAADANATTQAAVGANNGSISNDKNSERNPEVHRDMNASKMRGGCRKLAADSYKCLEKGDHEACKPFFDAYKECRKDEHAQVLAANGKRFGGD